MGMRIGLAVRRADLAVEVASLAHGAGGSVYPMDPRHDDVLGTLAGIGQSETGDARLDPGAGPGIDLLLVDVEWLEDGSGATGPGMGALWPARPPGRQAGSAMPVLARAAVLCRTGEVARARAAADRLGCAHVVELPAGAGWLAEQVSAPAERAVLGVVGALGGVGASTVAVACALAAGPDCLLVDADPDSVGLDLALGIPEGHGVRWAQLPDSAAPLDAPSLREALPQVVGVHVVTGPGGDGPGWGQGGSPGQLAGVLGVGRAQFPRTVVDLGRGAHLARTTAPGDVVALVVPGTVPGVVAGRRVLDRLGGQRVVVLQRPSGWLPEDAVAQQLGVPGTLVVPHLRRLGELADCGDLLAGRTGRLLRGLGEQVWQWTR